MKHDEDSHLDESIRKGKMDRTTEIEKAVNSAPAGEVVITTDKAGECIAVTRQDSEGEILSVIWERGSADGWKLVPSEPTEEMIYEAINTEPNDDGESIHDVIAREYRVMVAAAPQRDSET